VLVECQRTVQFILGALTHEPLRRTFMARIRARVAGAESAAAARTRMTETDIQVTTRRYGRGRGLQRNNNLLTDLLSWAAVPAHTSIRAE
jgi:hypothetical protein